MNIPNSFNIRERFIIYNNDFFNKLKEKTGSEWAAISIMAHEIGHHVKGHALSNRGSNHPFEFEADYYSGVVLAKMGASLEEAQLAMLHFGNAKATPFHPAKADRLLEIEKGWNEGSGFLSEDSKKEIARKNALKIYRKGEKEFTDKKFQEAINYFTKAKELGNRDAYFYLSAIYYEGMGVEINYFKAYELAKEGYELGSIPATFLYATYLADGFIVKKDKEAAERLFKKDYQIKWFKKEYLKTQIPYLATIIGFMNTEGYGGAEQSYETAILWYKKADSQGDIIAQHKLAIMYEYGAGVDKDASEAVYWYRKAAEDGYAIAQNNLGLMYDKGYGVDKDSKKAVYWYRKGASQGEALSIYNIGLSYYEGIGVVQDYKEAVYWYAKVANLPGHYRAQNNLGLMYRNGLGVEQDNNEAIYWYRKAAKQGYPNSQTNLAQMYKFGRGVEKDKEKAIYWYKKAAKQDYASAQNSLGNMYNKGQGVTQNFEEAFKWYSKAAKQGHVSAQYNLGYMYYNGEGIEEDKKDAFKWYKKAADQNFANAQYNVGYLYRKGIGVSQDDVQAVYWYQKASDQGDADAQGNLGYMYEKGHGVEKNTSKAIYWYQKSARQGNKKAQKNLTDLGETW